MVSTLATPEFIVCYGNAKPDDIHLLADIVAIDDEIVAWLRRRTRRQTGGGTAMRTDPQLLMMARMPIALTDSQLEQLAGAAAVIPHDQRDAFLRAVASRLDGQVDDGDLLLAINAALDGLAMAIAS